MTHHASVMKKIGHYRDTRFVAISIKLIKKVFALLRSMRLSMHDRTTISQECVAWLAQDDAVEAGEFILVPAIPACFKLLARSASVGGNLKASSSQCGEDLIIHHIFVNRGIPKPSYLDIGAHHPFRLSNTAIFYASGSRGVNVEPNPDLIQHFYQLRPDDINLQIAISDRDGSIDLHIPYDSAALATVLPDQLPADTQEASVVSVPCMTLSSLIEQRLQGHVPDFLSLDVEGHDLMILQQLSSLAAHPKVICVETVSYSASGHGVKLDEIISFLTGIGYRVYADTQINTIFVLASFWDAKRDGI
jgi:FkbM family methyltransferase